jgi:hypothetical protein
MTQSHVVGVETARRSGGEAHASCIGIG